MMESLAPYLAGVAGALLVSAAIAAWNHATRGRPAPAAGAPAGTAMVYRIRARVPKAMVGIVAGRLEEHDQPPLEQLLDQLEIRWDPPAAGPEAELAWVTLATSSEHAERAARRRLERLGFGVPLAVAADVYRLAP